MVLSIPTLGRAQLAGVSVGAAPSLSEVQAMRPALPAPRMSTFSPFVASMFYKKPHPWGKIYIFN